jgi:hypothetical protein
MSSERWFPDADRTAAVAVVDEKVLAGGIKGLLRSVDGIVISANSQAHGASAAEAVISRAGVVNRRPRVVFSASGTSARDIERRLISEDMRDPTPRASFGQCVYEFGTDARGTDLVDFALRGLRALGAEPVDGRWTYSEREQSGE